MDPSTLPLIGPLITAAARGIDTLIGMLDPLTGIASAPLVIAGITLVVRAALIPLDVRMVRAEGARRRLAPQLAALRTRWKKRPEELQKRTMQLYRDAGVSPLAGMGSMLAQAPIVSVLYLALITGTLAGEANPLVGYTLAGVRFAQPLAGAAISGGAATVGALIVGGVTVAALAVAGWAQRRTMLALQRGLPTPELPAGMAAMLGVLPFVTIIPALLVPLGAAIYLVVSTLWSTIERPLLRRILWQRVSGGRSAGHDDGGRRTAHHGRGSTQNLNYGRVRQDSLCLYQPGMDPRATQSPPDRDTRRRHCNERMHGARHRDIDR